MARVNLTLDTETFHRLSKHAQASHAPRAALARLLVVEALEHRERTDRRNKRAADYAAGRQDVGALLADLEAPQLELLDEEAD
jgi:hypothetical protein